MAIVFGRGAELGQVRAVLYSPGSVGVLLAGPMGTGKSTLLDAAVAEAEATGRTVIRLHANRATSTIPLFVFSGLGDETDGDGERYLAVRDELRARRLGGAPVVLAIDDVQELDDTSAALVAQVAREGTVTLVASVRTTEPTPEPIAALWSQGLAHRIEIGNLSRDAVAEMASDLLGGLVAPELDAQIWRRTGGNALHVRELVLGSVAAGAVTQVDGVWTRSDHLVATEALIDLVHLRIAGLAPAAQLALCAVALSEPASVPLFEQVVGGEALIALEEAGLVRVRPDRRRLVVRLAHPVYGEAIRMLVSQLRVRGVRLELAAAVQAAGSRRSEDLIQVAHWRLDAGDPDPELFVVAAFEAIRRHDFDLAAGLSEAAHAMQRTCRSARAVAMTSHLAGRHEHAVAVLAEALADPETDPIEASRAHLLTGLVLARGLGDYDGADRALRSVGDRATTSVRQRTAAMLALIPLLKGDARAGLAAAAPLFTSDPVPEAVTAYVGSLAIAGRPGTALSAADAYVTAHGDPDSRTLFPDFRWVALMDAGGVAQMDEEIARAWTRSVDDGDRHRQARLAFATGHVRAERGQLTEAVIWFERAAGFSRSIGEHFGVRWARCGQLLAAGQSGDLDTARAAIDELDRVPGHPAELFEIYGHRGRAWVGAAEGRPADARHQLLDLGQRLLSQDCTTHAVRTFVDAARLGAAPEAHAVLGSAGLDVDGELMPRCIALVEAMARADAGALGALSIDLQALGHGTLARAAASAACDVLTAAGRPQEAEEWGRLAAGAEATEPSGSEGGPVLDVTAMLTRREREIAHLVSKGLTSRQVAEACFLSVRTVDNHLSRIYDKLGVRSRRELADALGPLMIGAA